MTKLRRLGGRKATRFRWHREQAGVYSASLPNGRWAQIERSPNEWWWWTASGRAYGRCLSLNSAKLAAQVAAEKLDDA